MENATPPRVKLWVSAPKITMKGKLNGDGFTETGTDTEATGPA